ncbi:hypothetical protein GCM10009807_08080 [Microbacterium lacus]|uniref:O-antigen ligase domain-containing protein n=2 Tax=Microbacterium lacus TaxID=415217 RepID=A0ABN2G6W1_9MICO
MTAFLLAGVASSIINAVPFGVAGQGMLLIAKGFILAWGVAQLDWLHEDLRRLAKQSAAVAITLILGAVVNFLFPGPWSSIVLAGQGYGGRFGLTPVTSFFQHPGYFGTVMALSCLAALAHASVFRVSKTTMFIIVGSLVAAFWSARRKIFVGLAAAVATLGIRLRWTPLLVIALVGLPILLIVAWGAVANIVVYTYAEYFVNPDAVARVRLTIDSVGIAANALPFGAGFGRFGSAVARQNYSPLYYQLGYPNVWGLGNTEESGTFLTDTFWPAIIGETGLLGTIFFIAILATIFRLFFRLTKQTADWDRWLGLVGVAWSVQLLVESVAGAVYTAVPTFALFFAVVGIAAARGQMTHANHLADKLPEDKERRKMFSRSSS